jgi:hypothetical protein
MDSRIGNPDCESPAYIHETALLLIAPSVPDMTPREADIRLTCPVAIVGSYYPVSLYSSFVANVATFAVGCQNYLKVGGAGFLMNVMNVKTPPLRPTPQIWKPKNSASHEYGWSW